MKGTAPGRKPEGATRLVMENVNGFNGKIKDNKKLEKVKEINANLEADIVAYTEHRVKCRHKHNMNVFSQIFKGGEAEIQSL